jgi:hypothetical protein
MQSFRVSFQTRSIGLRSGLPSPQLEATSLMRIPNSKNLGFFQEGYTAQPTPSFFAAGPRRVGRSIRFKRFLFRLLDEFFCWYGRQRSRRPRLAHPWLYTEFEPGPLKGNASSGLRALQANEVRQRVFLAHRTLLLWRERQRTCMAFGSTCSITFRSSRD